MISLNFIQQYRIFFLFIFVSFGFSVTSQVQFDSVQIKKNDSLRLIKHELYKVNIHGSSERILYFDSTQYLIHFNQLLSTGLNNEASPTLFLFNHFSPSYSLGLGWNGWNRMEAQIDLLQSFQSNKPYSELFLQEGKSFGNSSKSLFENLKVGGMATIPFKNNLNWCTQYNRTIFGGIYQRQKMNVSSFASHLFWAGKKWDADIAFLSNNRKNQMSLGIVSDSFLTNSLYSIREAIPVVTDRAEAIANHDQYFIRVGYKISNRLRVRYEAKFNDRKTSYFDQLNSNSYSHYGILLVDSLSLSYLFRYRELNQMFHAITSSPQDSSWKVEMTAGLKQHWFSFDTLPAQYFVPHVNGNGKYQLNSRFGLFAYVYQELDSKLKQYDYRFGTIYKIPTTELNVKLDARIQSKFPDLSNSTFRVNRKLIWENKFDPIKSRSINISISSQRNWPELSVHFSNTSGLIFFQKDSGFFQWKQNGNAVQLTLNLVLQWRRFGLRNELFYNEIFNYQTIFDFWTTRHHIHYDLALFNRKAGMRLIVGVQLRSLENRLEYVPIVDQFQLGTVQNKPLLLENLSLGSSFQVQDFNLLLSFEHIDSFWNKRSSYVVGYPVFDFFINIGIKWKFLY